MTDFIFIHVPKTGGETIELLLNIQKFHDFAYIRKKAYTEKEWNSAFKFAFVRNPWDRLVSWYFHLRKHLYFDDIKNTTNDLEKQSTCYKLLDDGFLMKPNHHRELAVQTTFREWVTEILTNPIYRKPDWGPNSLNYNMLYHDNQLMVDEIFKFENYEENLKKILSKIGKSDLISKIQKTNRTIHDSYQSYYDEQTKELVRRYFAKDIETFGYKF
jgi:hypothetical protein